MLFVACLWLYTRNNTFPFFYHPDEPDKVEQVITGKWNFHHPLLMLETVKLAASALHLPPDEQQIVIVGRWVSAVFAAIGVVALALLAHQYSGARGFVGVAVLLGMHHQVFELAHYTKEDTALLMGVALTFLALAVFSRKQTTASLLFIGFACGLSLSAKYIGALVLIPALVTIVRTPSTGGTLMRHLAMFLAGLVITVAIANIPLIAHFDAFLNSFHREVGMVTSGQRGMTRRVPNSQYLRVFVDNSNPAVWLLLAAFYTRFWFTRRERSIVEWTIALFPIAFMLVLSCSPKTNDRYFLPSTALFACVAALGIADASKFLHDKTHLSRPVAAALLVVIAAGFQSASLTRYYLAFMHDDRRELTEFIQANLPTSAVIAQDSRVGLPTPDREARLKVRPLLPQKVIGRKMLADLGSMDVLVGQGVTHAAVSESDYGRFFLRSLVPKKEYRDEYSAKKAIYEDLFARGDLLWERPRGTVIYLHPGIRLYRLPSS